MAISASQQIALRRDFSLDEFKDEGASSLYINGSYPVTDEKYDDGTFDLTVSGVPKDACDRLVSMDWKQPKEILVNDGAGCQKGDGNVLAFTFYDDLDNQGKDNSDTPADDDDDTSDNSDVTDATEVTEAQTYDCPAGTWTGYWKGEEVTVELPNANEGEGALPSNCLLCSCRCFTSGWSCTIGAGGGSND